MKLTGSFVGIAAVFCCSRDLGVSANATDSETRPHAFYDDYRNLVWNCDTNADCTAPESSCVEKTCQCPSNYVFNAAMTSCLKVADGYGDTCEETVQCSAYLQPGGSCEDGICSCAAGYHYLHGRCIKSSGLAEKCINSDNCYANSDYDALTCTNNVCQCTDGFYQREYRTCRLASKEIGADCMIDLDCVFDKNAQCDRTKKCIVESNGSELNAFNEPKYEALRSLELGVLDADNRADGSCTTDKECEHLGPAICDAAAGCICKPAYYLNSTMPRCLPELGEDCKSGDTSFIPHAICRNGQWNCDGTVPAKNNRKCLKVTRAYNTSCTQHEQCYIFGPDASCVKKRCLCNENSHYSEENMFCWVNKGVGDKCERDVDCYGAGLDSGLTCSDKSVCECPTGTHMNAAGTACIDDKANLGNPCTANEDCEPLKNAVCQSNTCSCIENYFDLAGECVSGINGPCQHNDDCNPKDSTCLSQKCTCLPGFVSPSAGLCVRAASFGGVCQYDIQCSATASNALCNVTEIPEVHESPVGRRILASGTCACGKGYHYKYGRCYRTRVLNEPCDSRGECFVEGQVETVVCKKGFCKCNWGATEINKTYCKNDASSNMSLSSLIGLAILIVRFVGIL